jgi:hypothetical protein
VLSSKDWLKIFKIMNKKMNMIIALKKESVFISALMDSVRKNCFLEMINGTATNVKNKGIYTKLLNFSKYQKF